MDMNSIENLFKQYAKKNNIKPFMDRFDLEESKEIKKLNDIVIHELKQNHISNLDILDLIEFNECIFTKTSQKVSKL